MMEFLLSYGILPGLTLMVVSAGALFARKRIIRRIEQAYLDGVQDGVKLETKYAADKALEAERLARQRKLHDSGRRAEARPDAVPSRIHKARIAPPRPQGPDKRV